MSELPSEWKIKALGDVVEKIVGGGTPSKNNETYFRGNIPFMTVKDMKISRPKGTIDNITEEALKNSSSKLIEPNTLIISTRMGLGKIVKVKFPVAINQDLKALYLSDDVYQKFFEYQYQYKAQEIEALGTGTTVKGIRLETLKKIEMVFAPLDEQKRIAEKLDNVLAKVEAAQARLDKIPAILKRFRQSVLAAATSGELTKKWREENSNLLLDKNKIQLQRSNLYKRKGRKYAEAEEIGGEILDKLFDIPDSWSWLRAEEFCDFIT